jgi:hypothetical protein
MLDPQIIPLLYLCSIAGLIMVAGGIFLIYKEKIYIDRETKKVTEVETPIGKFKTNAPALVLFVLGFFPLIYPIYMAKEGSKMISISGELSSTNYPVNVYAVVESESLLNDGSYRLMVPAKSDNHKYKLIFYSHNIFIEDIADLKGIESDDIRIGKKNIIVPRKVPIFKKKIIDVPSDF